MIAFSARVLDLSFQTGEAPPGCRAANLTLPLRPQEGDEMRVKAILTTAAAAAGHLW
jgi:hypothetical protein